jgi:hypothetical protein
MTVTPKALPVAVGCPATCNIQLISQEGVQGTVNLTVLAAPIGVNTIVHPNPVNIGEFSEATSTLTVIASQDTPIGVTSLSIKATSTDQRISHTATITLNVNPSCTQQQSENNNITMITSVVTLTETRTVVQVSTSTTVLTEFTSTTTVARSLERTATESVISVWAIGATITVLDLAETLLLKRAK